jgi:putative transposase
MKRSRFSDQQIAFVLRQADEGTAIAEVCRKVGISEATYYNWRKKFGGLMPSEMRRLKQLEEENGKLKRIVADLALDKEIFRTSSSENYRACAAARTGRPGESDVAGEHPAGLLRPQGRAIELPLQG